MPESAKARQQAPGRKMTVLICVLILVTGAALTTLIFLSEPAAVRSGATRQTAMLVEVVTGERGNFTPTIVALGIVKPAQDIILSPRVGGLVIERSPAFTPGGFVKKGEILLRIDPADYENSLLQRQSDLRQAVAELNLEMGRQHVAQQDYQLLDETLSGENEALVLRRPQLNTARARVEAARAAVEQARLELERTSIRALFDAHILSTEVHVGSQVSPGDDLGRLVGIDTYWVETTVPLSLLRWLSFPGEPGRKGSQVRIRNRTAWAEGEYRTGHLYKLIGALEEQTRMARVLVSVEDPLAHRSPSAELPVLMIGSFVDTRIKAEEIADVIRLGRDYLRKDDTVWIMRDGKLDIRPVRVVFRDEDFAYIAGGLKEDEPVVTTSLSTVVAGTSLRLKSETAGNPGTKGE